MMTISNSWVKLDNIDNIKEGLTTFNKKRSKIAVFKENGQIVRVFDDKCPHNQRIQISTDFRIDKDEKDNKQITCAFHGACFDIKSGKSIKGPSETDLIFFEFQINENNDLLVKLV